MEVSRLRHKLMVYRALAALFFIGFVAVFAYARMAESGAKVQIGYFETKQADRQAELEAMRAEVDRLRAQVDALTKGPMPGLDKITFGMPIELDEGYVQYVELDTVDTGGSPAFGYRLLLRNGTTSLIQPQVTLHLFSDVGHPVGYAAVGPDEGYLAPNEKRTVEGRFRLEREGEPVYFRVDVN
jgi:cell division protein FtsB